MDKGDISSKQGGGIVQLKSRAPERKLEPSELDEHSRVPAGVAPFSSVCTVPILRVVSLILKDFEEKIGIAEVCLGRIKGLCTISFQFSLIFFYRGCSPQEQDMFYFFSLFVSGTNTQVYNVHQKEGRG
jgi:hypothetical protein